MRSGLMGAWMRPLWGGFFLFAGLRFGVWLLPVGVLTAVVAWLLKPPSEGADDNHN